MNSGDWTFTAEDPKNDAFMLQFSHSDKKRAFALRCVRDGKKSFRVIDGFGWEVVELHLRGLSYSEIATVLGITKTPVQERMYRAVKALKGMRGDDAHD